MKISGPTLMDIIAPRENAWLQNAAHGKSRALHPWVRVVSFGNNSTDDDDGEPAVRRSSGRRRAAAETTVA